MNVANTDKDSDDTMIKPVTDVALDQCKLGRQSELLAFSSREEACRLLTTMIDQASHQVVYFGRSLNSGLLGDSAVLNSISALMLRNRSAQLKTLVNHSYDLVQSGHRLVELLRHFMPAVECRIRRIQSNSFEGTCVMVDKTGYLYLPDSERIRGSASFNGIGTADKLYDVFDNEWQVAEPDPEIRPLVI
ncbi:MAG: hypothetical protein WBM41_17355 [Arenicellales bacterium]